MHKNQISTYFSPGLRNQRPHTNKSALRNEKTVGLQLCMANLSSGSQSMSPVTASHRFNNISIAVSETCINHKGVIFTTSLPNETAWTLQWKLFLKLLSQSHFKENFKRSIIKIKNHPISPYLWSPPTNN